MPTTPKKQPIPTPGQAFQQTGQFFDKLYNNPLGLLESPMQKLQRWTRDNNSLLTSEGNCAICGKNVGHRGVIDSTGAAGKGTGAILCPQHAMEAGLGIGSKKTAQFSSNTLRKMKVPQSKNDADDPEKKVPNIWESFQGGWESPGLTFDEWKRRFWEKGRRPRKMNWIQKWLTPGLRGFYRK